MRSMKYLRCAAAGGAVAIAAAGLAARGHADSIPPGWEANNMEPIGYSALDNRKGAFKMAIKKVNGHWYLYMGHLWHYGWSIVDVTDPKDPKFVKTLGAWRPEPALIIPTLIALAQIPSKRIRRPAQAARGTNNLQRRWPC
jgi:hypothetical protein